jgi:hypothetical protein
MNNEQVLTSESIAKTLLVTRVVGVLFAIGMAITIYVLLGDKGGEGLLTKSISVGVGTLLFFEFIRLISGFSLKTKLKNQSGLVLDTKGSEGLSREALDLVESAFDYAFKNIDATGESFTSFAKFLMSDGKQKLVRLASQDPEIVDRLAQKEIDAFTGSEADEQLVAYVIVQDANITLGDEKKDAVIVEAGCKLSNVGETMAQVYEKSPVLKEVGNLMVIDSPSPRFTV